MDQLKKEIIKASKKYGIGPVYEDQSVRNIKQQFDLNSAFKHRYASEGLGLPSSFVNKYRRSHPHLAHSLEMSKNPNLIVLKHPNQAIKDFKRQFFDSLSQPLLSTSRQIQKQKPMEIQVKVSQPKSGRNNQKQKQKISKPEKKKEASMEIEVKKLEVFESKQNRVYTEVKSFQMKSNKKVLSAQQKLILSCDTQTLPLSLPQKPQHKKVVSPQLSIYTTSSFHNQESVWKKYLTLDENQSEKNPFSSAVNSVSGNEVESKVTTTPSYEVPSEKTFVYNEFMGFVRGHESQPETKQQQLNPQSKNNSKKLLKIDLLTKEQMVNLYERYHPVIFPQEETSLMIKAMDIIEEQLCGIEYLDQVYLNYQKFGGKITKKDLQQKIVSDLLFVIREENIKVWNHANIQ